MPLHLFRCANQHTYEILVPLDHDKWQDCPLCEMKAHQIPSCPNFRLSWKPGVYDANPFEGMGPLEDSDGVNELTYKSSKVFVDQGKP
jgi:hypothetical protein